MYDIGDLRQDPVSESVSLEFPTFQLSQLNYTRRLKHGT